MTTLRFVIVAGVVAYGVAVLVVALFADRLILPAPAPSYDRLAAGMFRLPAPDGSDLVGLLLPLPDAPYTILYSHGNYEDLDWVRPRLEMLRRLGFQVFGYDYRGYGLSGGTASVANAAADARAAYDYVRRELGVPATRIVLYGRSIGGGPSLLLAAEEPVAGLILEGTFTTAFRVVTHVPILPFDRFDNESVIAGVDVPVLIMHGRHDRVVPFHHGPALYEAAGEPKRYAWFDAGHNDIPETDWARYADAVRGFTEDLDQRRSSPPAGDTARERP